MCHYRHPRHSHRTLHCRHACPRCVTDPVVASDGHSYERSAILLVINGVNRRSPLTREPLQPNVQPNLNLKKCILEFDQWFNKNVLDAVETVSKQRDETEESLRQQLAAANQQANPNPSPNPNLTLALALALALALTLTLTLTLTPTL